MTVLGTPAELAGDRYVQAARRLAGQLLAPAAERVDREGVPRSHLEALAAAGLLGLRGPVDYGGADVAAPVAREVTELLAGADGSTWFVAAQHQTPLLAVAASPNDATRKRWLRSLCRGQTLAGVAVSHLRRVDRPPVRATAVERGWRLDGQVFWMTSWGLADVVLLGAQTPDRRFLLALLPARRQPGLTDTGPLPLAAMGGTGTTQLRLTELLVRPEQVVDIVAASEWLAGDAERTANATPAVFGLLRAVLDRLHEVAAHRSDEAGLRAADRLSGEAARLRAAVYRLLDDVPAGERLADRRAHRAHAGELAVRAAATLVAAGGGAAMSLADPAQRYAREALFHLIQAQTAPVRTATLRRYGDLAR